MYSYENSTGKVNTHNRLHLLAIFFYYWHVVYGTGILQTRRACIQFIFIYCDPFGSLMLIVEYTLLIQINTCIKYVKKGQFTKQSTIHWNAHTHTSNLGMFSLKHFFANWLLSSKEFFFIFANYDYNIHMLYLVWNILYIHLITISG